MSTTSTQNLTFIIFIVSEKIAMFLPQTENRLASQPNTDHNIVSHFSCESKNQPTSGVPWVDNHHGAGLTVGTRFVDGTFQLGHVQ